MKPFLAFLSEAVAVKPKTAKPRKARKPSKAPVIPQTDTEPFKAKFDRLVSGTGIDNPWLLVGHGKGFDPSGEIERMKIAVFGKRTGSSQLGWYLLNGDTVLVDAKGNATHRTVEKNPRDYGVPDEFIGKIATFNTAARLRIEHHEGGGGMIGVAFTHRPSDHKAVIRSLRRKYPKYVIHDELGNEFMESHEAIHTSTERQMKTFSEFWDGVAGLRNRQRLDEGLDASLIVGADNERERVWDANTTHNHGVIAKAVDPKLYHILWHTSGTVKAKELIPILKSALRKMSTHRAAYKELDHKSGWGNVEHFSEFCADLLRACEKHPEARYEG
jgi:hypothetical protein